MNIRVNSQHFLDFSEVDKGYTAVHILNIEVINAGNPEHLLGEITCPCLSRGDDDPIANLDFQNLSELAADYNGAIVILLEVIPLYNCFVNLRQMPFSRRLHTYQVYRTHV